MPFTILSIKQQDYVSSNLRDVSFQTWFTGFKTHLSDINSSLMNIWSNPIVLYLSSCYSGARIKRE